MAKNTAGSDLPLLTRPPDSLPTPTPTEYRYLHARQGNSSSGRPGIPYLNYEYGIRPTGPNFILEGA